MYNPYSLINKTILVTGASSGIGRGIAIECSKLGANVVVTGRNRQRLDETFNNLEGEGHISIVSDLSTQDGIDTIVSSCPLLNGCVNCAGIPKLSTIKHIDRRNLEEIINVNQVAPILLTSLLLKKRILVKGSSIVFIASIGGVFIASNGDGPYAATKGAISGFVKAAAIELSKQKTRVNAICPGLVPTRILELSNKLFSEEDLKKQKYDLYPLGRVGTPEDIAFGAIYLLSDASSWVTGINLVIDGGYCVK
jgi:NAD(P)-dependent dehydrogenase (short-subunit alcohol dehydrogenase family)